MQGMTDREWNAFWVQTVAEQNEKIRRREVDLTPVVASFDPETEVTVQEISQRTEAAEREGMPLGRWGSEYARNLKKTDPEYYRELEQTGRLEQQAREIDLQGWEMMERLIPQYAKAQGVTEDLKARDQMMWVGLMNNIRDQIGEVIRETLIYS